jgi:hypothetical protein
MKVGQFRNALRPIICIHLAMKERWPKFLLHNPVDEEFAQPIGKGERAEIQTERPAVLKNRADARTFVIINRHMRIRF